MWTLSLLAFLLMGGLLVTAGLLYGVPAMVSDVYYQLEKAKCGWVFSAIVTVSAVLMMMCLLDTGKGVQVLAFLGCGGLAFVGVAPNYIDKDEGAVHKGGALLAALGCTGWCLSVCWWVTLVIGALYLAAVITKEEGKEDTLRPWYCAEVAAMLDVFITYWITLA